MQLKLKVFEGDFKALKAIILALFDLIINLPKCITINSRLSISEYQKIEELKNSKIYWKSKKVISN